MPFTGTDRYLFETAHDKTDKMACATIEDSDQPGHPPCLIRVFSVRMKKAWLVLWFCLFPLPLGVWEGLWFLIVAFPGLFSYLTSARQNRQNGMCDQRRLRSAWASAQSDQSSRSV